MRIELSNANWAEIREDVKRGDVKKVLLASTGDTQIERIIQTGDATLTLLITAWSFDLPLPSVDPSSLDQLEIVDYNMLDAACEPIVERLFPNLEPSANPDPASPTLPSAP